MGFGPHRAVVFNYEGLARHSAKQARKTTYVGHRGRTSFKCQDDNLAFANEASRASDGAGTALAQAKTVDEALQVIIDWVKKASAAHLPRTGAGEVYSGDISTPLLKELRRELRTLQRQPAPSKQDEGRIGELNKQLTEAEADARMEQLIHAV